ncbi:ATP-dependent helicase [Phormidium sp. FACHB-592]|uniref:UvrD-like helicase C-terminal domain-containing protein n=1 Tax=Stenomitos frigidus AS-A4 TaxID=2933935 RepID=A0ABV0KQS3_9CYAN|nr:ATP-dependent helicase [Phormidium sp. FACHB-592]MBD2072545.1 ATP-dependent helicase [Phormidium sp. FACHB-592]
MINFARISARCLKRDQDSQLCKAIAPSIKLVMRHSIKGLEFQVVCIPGVGYLPHKQRTTEDEAHLLYLAMVRAIAQLVLTCDRNSAFVQRLEGVLDSQRTARWGN